MKKNIILLGAILIGSVAYSQVGVNTETPKTTMDISAKRDGAGVITDNTQTYGLQAPRLTRAELTSSTATYGADQRGALVYITDISGGNTTGQRANITATGYYYFDGGVWQKVSNGAVPTGVDLTDDAFVNDAANTMVKLGTKADGATARDANTDFVIKDDGKVGIGTAAPSDALTVVGRMKSTAAGVNNAVIVANRYIDFVSTDGNVRTNIATDGGATDPLRINDLATSPNTVINAFSGNVGIGVAAPTHRLHVNGKIRGTHLTNGDADVLTTDLGLFNQTSGMHNRYVTNNAHHRFFVDGASGNNFIGGTEAMTIEPSGEVGIGTASPNARLDIRTNPTSTSNPGEGMFGLGTTTTAANTAGAGAVRYSTSSGGILQYSNGTDWHTLTGTVQRSVVVAKKTTSQTIGHNTSGFVTDWTEINDNNNNFNPSTGEFTAPRDGVYIVSFSFSFLHSHYNGSTRVEAQLNVDGDTSKDKKSIVGITGSGSTEAGASISFAVPLSQGQKIRPNIYQNSGSNKTLRVGTEGDDGFVNFSVAEL